MTYGDTKYIPSQCNNMFVFPGLGLGATVCGAKRVSRGMIYACSETLATSLTEEEIKAGQVFPSIHRIREISLRGHSVVRAAHRKISRIPRRYLATSRR